jgi:SNF2 family DNA or RNA helicase
MFLCKTIHTRSNEEWETLISLLPEWTMDCYGFLPRQSDGSLALKQHQHEKVISLLSDFKKGMNSFLADEMGMGKTLAVLALLQHIYSNIEFPPTLIVAPLTGRNIWNETLLKFTSLRGYRHWGALTPEERDYSFFKLQQQDSAPHVWVTTYEGLKSIMGTNLKYIQWGIVVVDEAQHFKNPQAGYEALLKIQTRHKILITGTPIHNSPYELWPLLHILDRFEFPIASMKTYCDIIDKLKESLQVFLLLYSYRMKS